MKKENQCSRCGKTNPAEIHTCSPGLYFEKEKGGQTTQQMLDDIYEKIADKTLKIGCRIKSKSYGDVILTEIFDCACDDILQYKIGNKLPHGEPLYLRYKLWSGNVGLDDIEDIIGHPISLSRVLSALGDRYGYMRNTIVERFGTDPISDEFYIYSCKLICERSSNKDGSDAMLDDQSPETIKAIREIVCK